MGPDRYIPRKLKAAVVNHVLGRPNVIINRGKNVLDGADTSILCKLYTVHKKKNSRNSPDLTKIIHKTHLKFGQIAAMFTTNCHPKLQL